MLNKCRGLELWRLVQLSLTQVAAVTGRLNDWMNSVLLAFSCSRLQCIQVATSSMLREMRVV